MSDTNNTKSQNSVKKIVEYIENIYPVSNSESWDFPGLIVGSNSWNVKNILFSVDITIDIVKEAIENNIDMIISHHPLFFKPEHIISDNTFRGNIINKLIENKIALYCGHTNIDIGENGTAYNFASLLDLSDIEPLLESGIGRVGNIAPISLENLAKKIKNLLPKSNSPIKILGNPNTLIKKVATVPGSGDSLFDEVVNSKADIYITSDIRHHPALDFTQQYPNIAIIDVPHSIIESVFSNYLEESIPSKFPEIKTYQSKIFTDPWSYSI